MSSPSLDKSLDFATKIVLFYEEFSKTRKETTIAKKSVLTNKSTLSFLFPFFEIRACELRQGNSPADCICVD